MAIHSRFDKTHIVPSSTKKGFLIDNWQFLDDEFGKFCNFLRLRIPEPIRHSCPILSIPKNHFDEFFDILQFDKFFNFLQFDEFFEFYERFDDFFLFEGPWTKLGA